jgi:hypothetical protein
MKVKFSIRIISLLFPAIFLTGSYVCAQKQDSKKKKQTQPAEAFTTNSSGSGQQLTIEFTKGQAHNHPLMAIWVEDTAGNYIQTLYVAQSIATGIFAHGDNSTGQWTQGEIRRPAALPYWSHKRGVINEDGFYLPTPENPVPDAYSGATPKNDFTLNTRLDKEISQPFNVLIEINQPWDWNEYWTNSKYMDDYEYKSSAQPAVIYQARIDLNSNTREFEMKVIGHGHYSGKDGNLYTDTSTLTTALQITGKIVVKVE